MPYSPKIDQEGSQLPMTQKQHPFRNEILSMLTAYVTLGAVALISLASQSPGTPTFWLLLVLFIALGTLFWFFPHKESSRNKKVLFLALQTVIITIMMILGRNTAIFAVLFFISSAQAMMIMPSARGFYWIALFSVIALVGFILDEGWLPGLGSLLIYAAGYSFFGMFGSITTQAQEERSKSQALLEELQEAHRQLQDYVLRVEELAVAEERNRLAREMPPPDRGFRAIGRCPIPDPRRPNARRPKGGSRARPGAGGARRTAPDGSPTARAVGSQPHDHAGFAAPSPPRIRTARARSSGSWTGKVPVRSAARILAMKSRVKVRL